MFRRWPVAFIVSIAVCAAAAKNDNTFNFLQALAAEIDAPESCDHVATLAALWQGPVMFNGGHLTATLGANGKGVAFNLFSAAHVDKLIVTATKTVTWVVNIYLSIHLKMLQPPPPTQTNGDPLLL